MQIFVAVKQIPVRDSALGVDADGKRLVDAGLTYEMNGPDAYALEAALKLRDEFGVDVVVLSAGPERVTKTIREALAKGAGSGIHILTTEQDLTDPWLVANAMAEVIRSHTPDLIMTGLQSEDACCGQTGVILAELLGYAHATIVTEIELKSHRLRVKRELEDGWSQYVTITAPAVLSIQSTANRPRLATMLGIRQAKTKQIQVVPAIASNLQYSAAPILERIYLPAKASGSRVFTGDARECARQLVQHLRTEAGVL